MKIIFKILLFLIFYNTSLVSQNLLIIKSEFLQGNDTVKIFIPSEYKDEGANKYPLIFMLHGWDANYNQWSEIADLQEYADEFKFIIVCPDGFYDSWYVDSPVNDTIQYEKFFFNELVPELLQKYKIDKSNIFITGLSMGGFGAISFFLKYNYFFKSAASTSGILDIVPFKGKWGMDNRFGPLENYKEYSPINTLNTLTDTTKEFLIDCGISDFAYMVNQNFYQECQRNRLNAIFISQKGNHSRDYWKKSIGMHLYFFSRQVNKK